MLRETKDSYYKPYFEDNKKNLRLVWQTIKGMININNKSNESISSLLIDNQITTSAKEITNHFNNFFTNVSEKINKNIVKSKKKKKKKRKKERKHLSYLSPENSNTIFLSSTLPEDIEDLITLMKTQHVVQIVSQRKSWNYSKSNFQNLKERFLKA